MARVEFERDEGYVVRRFRVTGALTPAEALRAEKLPKVGDPLSPKSPRLVVIKIDIEPCGTMEQKVVRGWWDVEVFYREVPAVEKAEVHEEKKANFREFL